MSEFVKNVPINCPYCGTYIREGRMRESAINATKMLIECKWICSKCGMIARRDEKQVEKA